ncbi:SDR family NAD(P)-dependent oxidoreductase, partial [Paenibacillus chondroitinus]
MFDASLLKDKVILITGGGTGLGRAMGERFLELGAQLAITSRREEVLAKAASEMDGNVFYKSCDVRDPQQIAEMVSAVEQHYGRIDVLINNAAGNFASPTENLSSRAVDAVLNIVLHGTFYTTLEVGKRWIEQGTGGTMLNIVTSYASTGSAFVVPSAAAKAGVLALT